MYYRRALRKRWVDLSGQFPVLLLTGPRQVGKTTFLRHIAEDERHYVTLDDPGTRLLANEDPVLFFRRYKVPLLIDEIQYAPGLLPYIKMEADRLGAPGLFWLTGSQQFQMMRGVSETLAGRVAILNLLGFSNRERMQGDLEAPPFLPTCDLLEQRRVRTEHANDSDLYERIWLGCYPALVSGKIRERDIFYSSYLRTYLERDVRDLTQVGDERAFTAFLRACAARTGQMLNLTELARDTGVSVPTAKSWLSILQTSFQVFLLQPYQSNLMKRLIKTPKLYFLDTGLCSYLTDWASPEALASGVMSGPILETWVLSELLKSWWNQAREPSLYYYRDKDGVEIDFVILQNQKAYPMEVKKAATPQKKWAAPFHTFGKKATVDQGGVLCLCSDYLPIGDGLYAMDLSLI